jgi:hypothetical protein
MTHPAQQFAASLANWHTSPPAGQSSPPVTTCDYEDRPDRSRWVRNHPQEWPAQEQAGPASHHQCPQVPIGPGWSTGADRTGPYRPGGPVTIPAGPDRSRKESGDIDGGGPKPQWVRNYKPRDGPLGWACGWGWMSGRIRLGTGQEWLATAGLPARGRFGDNQRLNFHPFPHN